MSAATAHEATEGLAELHQEPTKEPAKQPRTDTDPDAASNERYRVGQEMYIARVDPAALAAVRIDNSDPTNPKVIR